MTRPVSDDGTAALEPRPSPAQAHHTEENPVIRQD
jgi:hypothetical protein